MNLDVLNFLVRNREELIRDSANDHGLSEDNVWGVAQKVVGENSITGLSEKQRYLFDNALLPLIEDVPCQGWYDEFDGDEGSHFDCPSTIEEGRLIHCYQEESMLCESCEEEESFRASNKRRFMEDD